MKWEQWWNTQGWNWIVILSIIVLLFIYLFYNSSGTTDVDWKFILRQMFSSPSSVSSQPSANMVLSPRQSMESDGEYECRQFMEYYFRQPFRRCRPSFLRNPVTGSPLELDIYNDELKLAVEYHGKHHYEYSPRFHASKEMFQNQQYRDVLKKQLCRQNGIHLIEVPYTVKSSNIPSFLYQEIQKWR